MVYHGHMATSQQTIDYILEMLSEISSMRTRKMFGEYALYCDEKVVGFVCDDRLLLKITPASTAHVRSKTTGLPYPGAKEYYQIDENDWDDREYMTELIQITADSLPMPKPKKK